MRLLALRSMAPLAIGVGCRLLSLVHGFEVDPCAYKGWWTTGPANASHAEAWLRLHDQVSEFAVPWAGHGVVMELRWVDEESAR